MERFDKENMKTEKESKDDILHEHWGNKRLSIKNREKEKRQEKGQI